MAFLDYAPKVTRNLIIVNILVYILTRINPGVMYPAFSLYFPMTQNFHFWQPFTYMYMHGGFFHIFFNMYTLLIFGCAVENIIGSKKFFVFYTLCGLGAAALNIGVDALTYNFAPMVGASGSIYGVLLCYAMLFPQSRMTLLFPPVTLSAKWMVLIFIGIELVTGITGTRMGIAHFAHLGGMLMGFLLMLFWKKTDRLFNRDIWI